MVYVICFLIGTMAAFTGSLIGMGGGIVLIPALLFLGQTTDSFAWATPQVIVGISLLVMVFTALSSTLSYHRIGRIDYKTGMYFLTGSIPGSVIGSLLSTYMDVEGFSLYFGIIVLLISFLFFIRKKGTDEALLQGKIPRTFVVDGVEYHYGVSILPAFIISAIVGILSGLFGIGGGAIMVPAMILIFGFPAHIASATSMFMILFISIISSISHIALGHIAWSYAVLFIPGAYIGGKIGVFANRRLKGNTLEWILRILLIVIGIRLILDGLT